MAYEILVTDYQVLPYNLQDEVDKYTAELEAHRWTVDVPAPIAASEVVEAIVRRHGGEWIIIPVPEQPPPNPLPKDPKYYRTSAEQNSMLAKEMEEVMLKQQREEQ